MAYSAANWGMIKDFLELEAISWSETEREPGRFLRLVAAIRSSFNRVFLPILDNMRCPARVEMSIFAKSMEEEDEETVKL